MTPSPSTSTYRSRTPEFRSSSKVNRRPRPQLSCKECRRRKLKCDRTLPCNQCKKTRRSVECSYGNHRQPVAKFAAAMESSQVGLEPRAGATDDSAVTSILGKGDLEMIYASNPTTTSNTTLSTSAPLITQGQAHDGGHQMDGLQLRIDNLESMLQRQNQEIGQLKAGRPGPSTVAKDPIKSKSAKSVVYGRRYLFNEFDEAITFVRKTFNEPSMSHILGEFKRFHRAFHKKEKEKIDDQLRIGDSVALTPIIEMLPSHQHCDQLINIYIDTFTCSYNVLHVPTFLEQYKQFWEAERSSTLPGFIPQLAAIVAIASSLDGLGDSTDYATEGRQLGARLFTLIEDWLNKIDTRRYPPLVTMRIQCLLVLARLTGLEQRKNAHSAWMATGNLIRSAMVLNFHRDPSELTGVSLFEAEQRRKLWMTAVEMDLQASIRCGLVNVMREDESTCRHPSNFSDDDINDSISEYPQPKPLDHWTGSLPQVILAKSMLIRQRALQHVANGKPITHPEEVLETSRELEAFIANLPLTLQPKSQLEEFNHDIERGFNLAWLDMHLRRPLLCLFQELTSTTFSDQISTKARFGLLRSASVILSYRSNFTLENYHRGNSNQAARHKTYWDLFFVTFKDDIIQAALSICWEIKRRKTCPFPDLLPHEASPSDALQETWATSELVRIVVDTLNLFLQHLGSTWSDVKNTLRLSIVIASVQPTADSQSKEDLMRSATTMVLEACRKHLPATPSSGSYDGPSSSNNSYDLTNGFSVNQWAMAQDLDLLADPTLNFGLPWDFDWGTTTF
ncbi:hypothetical protein FQN57_005616 [Myotisia sp. PD_48]|nr:hypothetical protein FQN57_005616 [Myotisia sp. PD_48]